MKATLKSRNRENVCHKINFLIRDNEIVIHTEDGREIANLSVSTMDSDEEETGNDGFFLQFQGVRSESIEPCSSQYASMSICN